MPRLEEIKMQSIKYPFAFFAALLLCVNVSSMAKSKGSRTVYVCQNCGAQQPKWMGKCPDCGAWNSFAEEKPLASQTDASPRGGLFRMREAAPLAYQDIESQDDARQPSG